MTADTQLDIEALTQRISSRGREALLERLRAAYADAAAAHADVVSLDTDRLEALVQDAAERADGLQWRHALAGVAAQELGVSVGEAISHPAVARAQMLVGAPSYEQSLAELVARPVPPAARPPAGAPTQTGVAVTRGVTTATEDDATREHAALTQPIAAAAPVPAPVLPAPAEGPAPSALRERVAIPERVERQPDTTAAPGFGAQPADDADLEMLEPDTAAKRSDELRVSAIHIGGVANLPTRREGLDLRLSEDGLDIMHSDGEIIGRLVWSEIETLEVPNLRGRRRRQQVRARLVVRTPHGDATFEIPGITGDDLRDRIKPLLGRYGLR